MLVAVRVFLGRRVNLQQKYDHPIESMNAYSGVMGMEALEELRAGAVFAKDRRILDLVILARRRAEKVQLESYGHLAELFDKSALPAAAALPVFLTFLASEKLLADPWRTTVLTAAYVLGGAVWVYCRLRSHWYGSRAKRGAATLGKVD